jgi:hypothetical protein
LADICIIYSQLCTGSLGDPVVDITFGNGSNPGQKLSAITPGASTTYTFLSVTGNPALPTPSDGSYTVTNNVPYNFVINEIQIKLVLTRVIRLNQRS